ncbi:MAG: helix-turn-helix domain-containing protein [Bacteroidetes bacterium]|nr:helix-turn-helix domain-containing protein [Bacteroidota bacterium]
MKTTKLLKKYASKDLAESFVFRTKLNAQDKKKSDRQLHKMRKSIQEKLTPKQILLSRLMQLKYQIEDYSKNTTYNNAFSFGYFLRAYLKSLNKKNKDFANDIDIDETELSQILNQHRNPSEKVIIRLELHSNKAIPAITWYRLLEKEKEHEILTDTTLRRSESRHVRNRLQLSI